VRRFLFVLLFLAVPARGQNTTAGTSSGPIYPGSAWTEVGNYSPTEATVIANSYVEQGIKVWQSKSLALTPYAALTTSFDTKGYDWENKLKPEVGVKLTQSFTHGLLSIGTAYAIEDRFKSGTERGGAIGYVNYWFGWHSGRRFPGSSWGVVGNITPIERNNVIMSLYLQQGVVAARVKKVAVVPFGEGTLGRDTHSYDWNNKAVYGGGLKAVVAGKMKVVEIGGSYLNENRFIRGRAAGGFNLFLKVWTGWGRGRE
jgi:hypothetical protein